jgi:hypothetical protein
MSNQTTVVSVKERRFETAVLNGRRLKIATP